MPLFESLTVLSIEQATTLPFLTLRLAQDGMRVIRVERPPRGDPNRWVGPEVLPCAGAPGQREAGMNAYFLPHNLGKQSISLDLANPEGRRTLQRLIVELPVDIFATNQRPGSYRRLGIDYETLAARKPDLIWVGITGFGPDHDEAAYDPILQARAGFMDLTGEPDGPPMVFGLPMVDLGAGEHAYGQVMKALYRRVATGAGSRIDLSMFQSAVSWMSSPFLLVHSLDEPIRRQGNTHQFFAPVSVYPTRDGHVYLAVGNDAQWQALTELPAFENLRQPAYERNAGRIEAGAQLNQAVAHAAQAWDTEALIEALRQAGIPVGRVNRVQDLAEDPLIAGELVRARDPQSGVEIAIPPPPVVPQSLRRSGMRMGFPPRLGEHTQAVLAEIGVAPPVAEGEQET